MPGEYFEVRVEGSFKAVHAIDVDGGRTTPHQHRWQVAIRAGARELDAIAIVVDFRRLRADLEVALAQLEGSELEGHDDFAAIVPDAAAVGRWLLRRLRTAAAAGGYHIVAVEVECDEGIRWVIGAAGAAAHAPV